MAATPEFKNKLKIFPEKRQGESEAEFQKRILDFMQENDFPAPQIKRWTEEHTLIFRIPEDKNALQSYLTANPDSDGTLVCSDRSKLKDVLSVMKEIDGLKNVAKIDIGEENNVQEEIQGMALKNLKNNMFPGLRPY